MALSSPQIASLENLLNLLLVDDAAGQAVCDAASRRCSPSVRDSVFAVVARAKPGYSYGSTESSAAANIASIITELEAL